MQTHGLRAGQEGAKKGIGFVEVCQLYFSGGADRANCLCSRITHFTLYRQLEGINL